MFQDYFILLYIIYYLTRLKWGIVLEINSIKLNSFPGNKYKLVYYASELKRGQGASKQVIN